MLDSLLIALPVLAVLACPLMMLLGRRGIGPGCALMPCRPKERDTLAKLRERQRELARMIQQLEEAREPDQAIRA